MSINVDIVGATGYTGQELIEILAFHPNVRINGLYSTTDEPKKISELLPKFKNRIDLVCKKLVKKELVQSRADLVFLAMPHTNAMDLVPDLLSAKKHVIDLSADYRLKNTKVFESFYKVKHKDEANLSKAVYGLPELYRNRIKGAKLIANPGCYPTAAILGIAPLLATDDMESDSVIIDAKSGTSGAGKKPLQELLFSEVDEDFKPYKVNTHQHMPEMEQEFSKIAGRKLKVDFVPHLLPVKRGILESIYVKLPSGKFNTDKLVALYSKFYKREPFVRIKDAGQFPRLKDVAGTNFCDIGVSVSDDRAIIISAIDNLLKGASGQAVQNMNIAFDFEERAGLK